jgi:transcriptional regulator with XRE-family HTH domain
MSFADHLRELRDDRDFSLRELAEGVGVAAAAISESAATNSCRFKASINVW